MALSADIKEHAEKIEALEKSNEEFRAALKELAETGQNEKVLAAIDKLHLAIFGVAAGDLQSHGE